MKKLVIGALGSGKTTYAITLVAKRYWRHAFFVLPTRSLAREVYERLSRLVPSLLVMSEHSVSLRRYAIVTTYGKFSAFLRFLRDEDIVVFDEAHLLTEEKELMRIYAEQVGCDIVLLSATLPSDVVSIYSRLGYDVVELEGNQGARHYHHIVNVEDVIMDSEGVEWRDLIDYVADLAIRLSSGDGIVMVYAPFRRLANLIALRIAELLGFMGSVDASSRNSDAVLRAVMNYGVLIHHGGLSIESRKRVFDLLKKEWRKYPILVTCLTLSMGVNFPIRHLIVTMIHDARYGYISPELFNQMVGRCGRGVEGVSRGDVHVVLTASDLPYYVGVLRRLNSVFRPARFIEYPYMGEFLVSAVVRFRSFTLWDLIERTVTYLSANEESRKAINENYEEAMSKIREVYGKDFEEVRRRRDVFSAMLLGITPEEFIDMRGNEELLMRDVEEYLRSVADFVKRFYGDSVTTRFADDPQRNSNMARILERREMYYRRVRKHDQMKNMIRVLYTFYQLDGMPYPPKLGDEVVSFKKLKWAIISGVRSWVGFLEMCGGGGSGHVG